MVRVLTPLFFAWALLLAPSLCAAGLLEHACGCESEQQCQHEDSCSSDPCATVTRPQDQQEELALDVQWVPTTLPTWSVEPDVTARLARTLRPPVSPGHLALPFAQSDVPLLI